MFCPQGTGEKEFFAGPFMKSVRSRMKALVIEDDQVSRLMVQKYLEAAGFHVVACPSGQEGLNIIKEQGIRVAIIDWVMPGMDGVSLCRKVRSLGLKRYIYMIILTGKNRKNDLVEAFDAGADDFITKPFDRDELISRVKVGVRIIDLEDKRLKTQKELLRLAKEDPLTNLLNRRALLDEVLNELNRSGREGRSVSAIMVDVDNFKRINDRHGHIEGDAILTEFAERLQKSCRPYDKVGRYGGEEFLVLLPNTPGDAALTVAERMLGDVNSTVFLAGGRKVNLSASFGVATITPGGKDREKQLDELIRMADQALYKAKKKGKGRVEANS